MVTCPKFLPQKAYSLLIALILVNNKCKKPLELYGTVKSFRGSEKGNILSQEEFEMACFVEGIALDLTDEGCLRVEY